MIVYENIRLALFSLKANKMRSLLTMLGIIIGIASVIAIMTVGDSVTATVTESMSSLGANNISVALSQKPDEDDETTSFFGMTFIDEEDQKDPTEEDYITADMLQQIKETLGDSILAFSITESVGSGEIQQGKDTANVSVRGTTLGYFLANDIEVIQGSYFGENELSGGGMVAMLSEDALDDLFDGDPAKAVGSTISVAVNDKYYSFIISGVYREPEDTTGTSAMMSYYFGGGDSTDLYIPLKTAQSINHTSGYQSLTVVVNPEENPDDLAAEIESIFDNLYRNNRDFEVTATSLSAMVSIMENIMGTLTTAIALIAGIALLVGGIGVMNIMLVSITERTREIGTRKALGAPNSSIRLQFIIESIVICLIGGAIGIAVGCAGGIAAANYVGASATPSLKSILISLGFSMAIGVFFGYYPANKAAKLNPIDALRYE
jgi:putative ABC transport system permease protein